MRNPKYVVDGLFGGGKYPPFKLFNTVEQRYMDGKFNLRAFAQAVADELNKEVVS